MGTNGKHGAGAGRARGERGFSLVEMMSALFAAAVIGVGLYMAFNAMQRSSVSQRLRNDVQTNCAFALDRMKTEMSLGGYRATNQLQPISAAAAGSITFEYWDDNATFGAPYAAGFDNHTQVTYRRATAAEAGGVKAGDLVREIRRYNTATHAYETPTKQVLVDNTTALSFAYFQNDNQVWGGANLGDIRTIRTTLTCEASKGDPVLRDPATGGDYKQKVTLTAEVRARNVGVSSTPADTTPPATPTGLIAWDPGTCGTLNLRWNANTDADLEAYILVAGLATGQYSKRVRIPAPPRAAGQSEYYTLTGLTSAKTTDTTATAPRYYIALQALDKSGNLSTSLSAEASGNPTTSSRTEAQGAANPDTTIHPLPPPAPTAFTAAATPSVDNSISLSWVPPAAAELAGFRVYRGESASFVPNDTPVTGNRIASETVLGAGATSFTDTGADLPEGRLVGCRTYYYKICPVICDPTLVATYTSAQYAAANAAPTDGTAPSNPVIAARPGYRRIILTLTNPVRSGPGSDPDFSHTKVYWSKTGYPTIAADGTVTPNTLIPRSGGTFTGTGTLPTINFNDETSPTATAPNLAPDTTYFFLAVAYDLCGNHTDVNSSSIAEGTQCGDCLLPAPAPPGTPDPACYEAPPGQQPTGADAEGCYGYADLSWNPVDDVVIRDFQGYRISRREGASWVGGTNEVNLTGDDAAWITTFTDATVEEGKRYSYRIMATDCYYEQHHGKSAAEWPEAGNDPNDNYEEVFVNDVAVGRPLFDATRPEVLTGTLATAPPFFYHTPVTFWIRNASDTRLTLSSLGARWENPDAWLQRIVLGDGSTTPVTTAFDDPASPLTHGSTGSTIPLASGTRLDALDGQIPFSATFLTSGRSVDSTTDMRAERIDFTVAYQNDSTGTEGCGVTTSVYAPLGPYIYSVSQSKPYFGTLAWAVPGEQGTSLPNSVTVPGGADVTVYAEVLDASTVGIATGAVRLFYAVDTSKALTSAPAVTGTYPSLNYTSIAMTKVAGDQWTATIPAVVDANVWYFVVAVDAQGNFDRDPEPWAGAYQYYQQPPNNCSTIPNPPTIAGSSDGTNVTLTWAVPTTNATPSGSAYTDGAGFKVYRNRNGEGWTLHYAGTITNPATTTFTDSAVYLLGDYRYEYYVTSYDSCTPTANQSAASNIYTETVESVCGNTPSAPVISGTSSDSGGSVTLAWSAPTTNAPPSAAPLTDLAGYRIYRQRTVPPLPPPGYSLFATLSPSASVYWTDYSPTSTGIRNNIFSYYVTAYDSCTPTAKESAPSNTYTENESLNPCIDVPGSAALSGSSTASSVTLTWALSTNADGSPLIDLDHYIVERSTDGVTWIPLVWLNAAAVSYVDTPPGIDTTAYQYRVKAYDTCTTAPGPYVGTSNVYLENYSGPCATTPNPPGLGGSTAAGGVTLTWTAPALNTDGSPFSDPGGYRLYRRRTTAGTWALLASFGSGTFSYVDAVSASNLTDLGTADYYYYVTTVDSCTSPAPNESGPSGTYAEGYTDPCAVLPTPFVPPTLTAVASSCTANGGKVTLTWSASTPVPDGGYRVYGCTCAGTTPACACVPATKLNTTDPLTVLTFQHTPGGKLNAVRWRYGVKAVNKGACTDSARWKESLLSPITWDMCTPQ